MVPGAEVQYGPIRYGVASLHRGEGGGCYTKRDSDIFVMDLCVVNL